MVFTTVGGLYVTRISHGFYHCWWTVIHKISQVFYHCWWTVSDKDITRFLPLLVDCHSQGYHKVFTTVGGLAVTRISQGFYHCWWTVSHKNISRFADRWIPSWCGSGRQIEYTLLMRGGCVW